MNSQCHLCLPCLHVSMRLKTWRLLLSINFDAHQIRGSGYKFDLWIPFIVNQHYTGVGRFVQKSCTLFFFFPLLWCFFFFIMPFWLLRLILQSNLWSKKYGKSFCCFLYSFLYSIFHNWLCSSFLHYRPGQQITLFFPSLKKWGWKLFRISQRASPIPHICGSHKASLKITSRGSVVQ